MSLTSLKKAHVLLLPHAGNSLMSGSPEAEVNEQFASAYEKHMTLDLNHLVRLLL